jgi:hypothetical protein
MTKRIAMTLLGAALAVASLNARAELKNLENAYESDVGQITLPGSKSGRVTIRNCPSCRPVVLRVTDKTVYRVGASGPPVTLAQLREAVAQADAGPRLLTVYQSVDSGIVTRIVLSAN